MSDSDHKLTLLVDELIEAAEDHAFKGSMHPDDWEAVDERLETAKVAVNASLLGLYMGILEIAAHGHRGGQRGDPAAIARDVLRKIDELV